MATMPEQFLEQNFTDKPNNHVAYKAMSDIRDLGESQASGRAGLERFQSEMEDAGLAALQIGNYCVVYRNELKPVQMWT